MTFIELPRPGLAHRVWNLLQLRPLARRSARAAAPQALPWDARAEGHDDFEDTRPFGWRLGAAAPAATDPLTLDA